MKFSRFSVFIILLTSATVNASNEFRGLEWLEKYRDAEGCISLKRLVEKQELKCPEQFSPQIRPYTLGKLNKEKTDTKQKVGKEVCCYIWNTFGNR